MNDTEKYLKWLDFAIENQRQIAIEEEFDYSLWNQGYINALLDAKSIFNDLDLIDHWPIKRD